METLLTEVEKRLFEVSSLLNLIQQADYDESGDEILALVKLAEEIATETLSKVTRQLLAFTIERKAVSA